MIGMVQNLNAQSDLEIFGFSQSRYIKSTISIKAEGDIATPIGVQRMVFIDDEIKYMSPFLQQLNLIARKEMTNDFTAFINFEFINNFSTENNWGNFNVEEAWLNYRNSSAFNVKAGWLVPKFNYLNEIKNKMPLLPYINRPFIYETALRGIIESSDYLPERAFLQIFGNVELGDFDFEYAVYTGPSETSYTFMGSSFNGYISGADTSKFKLFGGRVGVNYNNLRLGVSSTIDRHNNRPRVGNELGEDLKRTRVGLDLGFSFYNFYFDAEFVKVFLDSKKTALDLDKLFYYGTLEYDFTDQIFIYVNYSCIEDKGNDIFKDGFFEFMLGGGYRVTNEIVLKVQYENLSTGNDAKMMIGPGLPLADVELKVNNYSVAFSILF
jgi:hypothetical protein